jgi:hypothetical protein
MGKYEETHIFLCVSIENTITENLKTQSELLCAYLKS